MFSLGRAFSIFLPLLVPFWNIQIFWEIICFTCRLVLSVMRKNPLQSIFQVSFLQILSDQYSIFHTVTTPSSLHYLVACCFMDSSIILECMNSILSVFYSKFFVTNVFLHFYSYLELFICFFSLCYYKICVLF